MSDEAAPSVAFASLGVVVYVLGEELDAEKC